MKKMIMLGAVCLSATMLLAQTDKQPDKKVQETAAPPANTPKFIPFNMKTGLWEDTLTTSATGAMGIPPDVAAKMTPEQKARFEAAMSQMTNGVPRTLTYKKCVTKDDLNKDPFSDPKEKCTWTTLTSDGTKGQAQGTCIINDNTNGMTGKMDVNIKYEIPDQETVKGSGTIAVTINGHTMNSNGHLTGKWLGATCPAGTN